MRNVLVYMLLAGAMLLTACGTTEPAMVMTVPVPAAFSDTVHGKAAVLYVLKNNEGMEAYCTNYGARLISLLIPDERDSLVSVVQGFDSLAQYRRAADKELGAVLRSNGLPGLMWNAMQLNDSTIVFMYTSVNGIQYSVTSGLRRHEWFIRYEIYSDKQASVDVAHHIVFNRPAGDRRMLDLCPIPLYAIVLEPGKRFRHECVYTCRPGNAQ